MPSLHLLFKVDRLSPLALSGRRWAGRGLFLVAAGMLAAFSGCGRQEEISVQRVYNLERAQQRPISVRTLAALVPQGDQAWFFKVTGPAAQVGPHAKDFDAFLDSVTFSSEGQPTWKLPQGWEEKQGQSRGMRFATIQLGTGQGGPELTVIPLPAGGAVDDSYVLANVNRWRQQLNLKPLTADDLASETQQRAIAGEQATVVNLVGQSEASKLSGGPMSGGPMAGGPMAGGPMAGGPRGAPAEAGQGRGAVSVTLKYTTPKGWTELPASGLRTAAFDIIDGPHKAVVTVIELGPNAKDAMANINRWRNEVDLPPITAEELKENIVPAQVGGYPALLVEMIGKPDADPQKTILGLMALVEGKPWFFKLLGDSELAAKQKDRFLEFAEAVQFEIK